MENGELIRPVDGASIVNLEANFTVPAELQGKDFVFPRMDQFDARMAVGERNRSIVSVTLEDLKTVKGRSRPFRRPDFDEEWKFLKKTWSLYRRGRTHLVDQRLQTASETYYADDPLKSLQDWLWRFALYFSQPHFEPPFQDAFKQIQPLLRTAEFRRFCEYYNANAAQRGARYFEVMEAYFDGYHQFTQVHFDVVRGIEVNDENMASSVDFASVKKFYGDAFEALGSNVDILAFFANMIAGRAFDEFQTLTLKDYLRLDKGNRFGPIAGVAEFDQLCAERDNKLRNASHHGGTRLDAETQIISYRDGKGGQGEMQELRFVKYLEKSDRIFLQLVALFRIEIMMTHALPNLKMPI